MVVIVFPVNNKYQVAFILMVFALTHYNTIGRNIYQYISFGIRSFLNYIFGPLSSGRLLF